MGPPVRGSWSSACTEVAHRPSPGHWELLDSIPPMPATEWGFKPESNPEHWESLSLSAYNEHLLAELGGSWEAPPDLPSNWEGDDALSELGPPLPILNAAYPEPGPRVWKDPRLCLLLPLLENRSSEPLVAVLIWRSPLAVARSLQKRDGLHLADGIALWERYNRAALANLVGVNTFVCNYEAVVARSSDGYERNCGLAECAARAVRHGEPMAPRAVGRLDCSSRLARGARWCWQRASPPPAPRTRPPSSRRLKADIYPFRLPHSRAESDWTTALLAARNGSQTHRLQVELQNTQTALDRLRNSTSWRATKPFRSVISSFVLFARISRIRLDSRIHDCLDPRSPALRRSSSFLRAASLAKPYSASGSR